jgi:hypothetical protein
MVRKIGLFVAAIALAAFAAAPSDSFAASKKSKATEENSFKDVKECTGGACTSVNPDRVPSEQHQYRRTHKKHKPS